MPKAYSYIRFSTPEQAQGDSLRRQIAKAEKWCAERGLTIDQSLRDEGISAHRGANTEVGSALGDFLVLVKSGRVEVGSYLIVESLDRLSRETILEALPRFLGLLDAGIIIVTLIDGQIYSKDSVNKNPYQLFGSLAVMARAHEESVTKSVRVSDAWAEKKTLARTERKPLTPRCPKWLELVDGQFVERPERVALVRRIFRETIEGAGRREIVRRLNLEGVPTFKSEENRKRKPTGWHTSSVAKIIQSRAVLGEYQPHSGTHKARNRKPEGDPVPGFYPAIVDEETFWRAQAATQGRRQRAAGRRGNTGGHILQGLARCHSCGDPMHIINKGAPPKGGIYLACSGNQRKTGCANSRRWRVDKLEPALLTALGFVDAKAFTPLDNEAPLAAEKAAALRAQFDDAQTRQQRLLALFETGEEEAVARYQAIADEVKALKKSLKAAEAEASKLAADPGLVARLSDAATLSRQLESADAEQRRELRIRLAEVLRGLVQHVECTPDLGAIMVLKPRLGVLVGGIMPFAFRMTAIAIKDKSSGKPVAAGIVQMLLEPDADDSVLEAFMAAAPSPEVAKSP